MRPQLAARYREAGMAAFATFVSPDETINCGNGAAGNGATCNE